MCFPFERFMSLSCSAVCVIQLNPFLTLFTSSELGAVKWYYFVSLSLMEKKQQPPCLTKPHPANTV